jgi:hypothetical protein
MKRIILTLVLVLVVGVAFYSQEAKAQMGPGMMGPDYDGDAYSPNCGQYGGPRGGYGMGRGMMGRGYGMDRGMMRRGYGMGPGMMGPGNYDRYGEAPQELEETDAKTIVENYLKSMRNPNLKLGKIKVGGNFFEVEVVTKENSLVDKLIVDKYSGWMRSVY